MALPALLLAGGKLGLKLLPAIGAVAGAQPGLRRGNLGEAALGAGFGALTGGMGTGGVIKGATRKAMRMAGSPTAVAGATNTLGQLFPNLVDAPIRQALVQSARIGVPLAGIGATAKLAGMTGGLGAGGIDGSGIAGPAGLIGYGSVGGEGMAAGGVPVPPGMGQFGGISPFGDPLQVINPAGLDAGRRLRTIKDAEALRDASNIVLPTVRKFAEQAKRDEFARGMAAAGIKQNILTNANLTENMQKAALNLGTTAANQAGAALTARYNY